ncbi:MAG: hypothetical protein WD751_05645 [Anaerolineales bacterium]
MTEGLEELWNCISKISDELRPLYELYFTFEPDNVIKRRLSVLYDRARNTKPEDFPQLREEINQLFKIEQQIRQLEIKFKECVDHYPLS